jgi:glycosyltransferase involved in cell wall biosynthesis
MRILVVTPEYPPQNVGGGGVVVRNLSTRLIERGHQVRVLSGDFEAQSVTGDVRYQTDGGLSVDYVPYLPPETNQLYSIYKPPALSYFHRLIQVLDSFEPDLIHLHGFGHVMVDTAAISAVIKSIPYVVTIHGIPREPERKGGILSSAFSIYSNTFGKFLLRHADRVIAVSEAIQEEVQDICDSTQPVVIPNGIERGYGSDVELGTFRKQFDIDPEESLLLCVGALEERKGFQHAIQALPEILNNHPKTQLIIVGRGSYREELERLIKQLDLENSVQLAGYVDEQTKKNALADADIVLIPSEEEPFGLTALESMSLGNAVIASATGGLKDVIGMAGILVEPASKTKIATPASLLLDKPSFRDALEQESQNQVQNFTWNSVLNQYEEVIENVA